MNKFILVGYVFVLLLKYSAFIANGQGACKISNTFTIDGVQKQLLFYNCTELTPKKTGTLQQISHVPLNLNADLEALDFSRNAFDEMFASMFAKYTKMKYLIITDTIVLQLGDDTFKSMNSLEELNLCAFSAVNPVKIDVPANLKKFKACQKRLELNLIDAVSLTYVDISFSDRISFPNFNTKAPLEFVNFDGNTMNDLKVEQLAPYCHLKELSATLKPSSQLLTPSMYCECSRLNLWMTQFEIKATPIECASGEDVPCNKEFSEDILSLRRACIGDEARVIDTVGSSSSSKLVVFGALFLILVTLLMLALAYRYVRLREQSGESDDSNADESAGEGENDTEEGTASE